MKVVFAVIFSLVSISLFAVEKPKSVHQSHRKVTNPEDYVDGDVTKTIEAIVQKRSQTTNVKLGGYNGKQPLDVNFICSKIDISDENPYYEVESYFEDNFGKVLLITDKVVRDDVDEHKYWTCRMGNVGCDKVFVKCPDNNPQCNVPGTSPLNTTTRPGSGDALN